MGTRRGVFLLAWYGVGVELLILSTRQQNDRCYTSDTTNVSSLQCRQRRRRKAAFRPNTHQVVEEA